MRNVCSSIKLVSCQCEKDKAIDKKKTKNIYTELETIKKKYKCEFFKVSALTSEGVGEAFRKFLSKIHQKKIDEKQNEGVEDVEDVELEEEDVRVFNFSGLLAR